jgi:D-tyrosyl-tRNA(Tyr) deacylase
MKAVIQRVSHASVTVNGQDTRSIGRGIVVLLAVGKNDTDEKARRLADKIVNLRIFPDEEGKFDRSLQDIKGELLIVSQFTLYGNCNAGRRPDCTAAARPDTAIPLYEKFIAYTRQSGLPVQTGYFGTDMQVEIHNDGPVTFLIDTER